MSENTEKNQEKEILEEEVMETDVQETSQQEAEEKEAPVQEKKGFLKRGGKEKAKIEELEKKVAELEEKTAKEKDSYIRLMAEFDNYRRRTAQEKLELVSMASTDTIKGLDDFELIY